MNKLIAGLLILFGFVQLHRPKFLTIKNTLLMKIPSIAYYLQHSPNRFLSDAQQAPFNSVDDNTPARFGITIESNGDITIVKINDPEFNSKNYFYDLFIICKKKYFSKQTQFFCLFKNYLNEPVGYLEVIIANNPVNKNRLYYDIKHLESTWYIVLLSVNKLIGALIALIQEQKALEHALKIMRFTEMPTLDQLKKKYKQLALQYHPDKNPNNPETEKFQTLGESYNFLRGVSTEQVTDLSKQD